MPNVKIYNMRELFLPILFYSSPHFVPRTFYVLQRTIRRFAATSVIMHKQLGLESLDNYVFLCKLPTYEHGCRPILALEPRTSAGMGMSCTVALLMHELVALQKSPAHLLAFPKNL